MTEPLTVSKDPPLGLFLPEIVILGRALPRGVCGNGKRKDMGTPLWWSDGGVGISGVVCVLKSGVRHPFDLERGLRYDESTGGDARSSFGLFDALT